MDIKDIRKIIEMMKQYELSEFELQDEGFRIAIKRRGGSEPSMVVTGAGAGALGSQVVMHSPEALPTALVPPPAVPEADHQDDRRTIKSPMVGTFYRASAPDAEVLWYGAFL